MRYLRKFNEDISNECDFETFKDIMYEISDDYGDHYFKDYSNEEDPYYELRVNLNESGNYTIQDDVPYLNFEFLNLAEIDDPESIIRDFNINDLYSEVNSQNNNLLELKSKIDMVIKNNNQITDIFKKVESIVPRFETFSNFKDVLVGFDKYYPCISISFEIKKENDESDNDGSSEIGGDDWRARPDQYPF